MNEWFESDVVSPLLSAPTFKYEAEGPAFGFELSVATNTLARPCVWFGTTLCIVPRNPAQGCPDPSVIPVGGARLRARPVP